MRNNGVPYITHPVRVAEIIKGVKPSSGCLDILVSAALLHDTIEDTDTSFKELEKEFGKVVASIVMELSSAPFAANLLGKVKYMCGHMIGMTNYALTIKLADRLDNITDMQNYTAQRKQNKYDETKEILEFLSENRTLTKTQKAIVDKIYEAIQKATEA
jgi:guanosine-3',5'-bis(diphosphate) 3'-pyrophosphohydrolase